MMQITPVFVGGEDARDVNDPKAALKQLTDLAEEQHRRAGGSFAQAFATVYAQHPELAKRERAENRPQGHPSYSSR
jgi:hypothetical protein